MANEKSEADSLKRGQTNVSVQVKGSRFTLSTQDRRVALLAIAALCLVALVVVSKWDGRGPSAPSEKAKIAPKNKVEPTVAEGIEQQTQGDNGRNEVRFGGASKALSSPSPAVRQSATGNGNVNSVVIE